MSNIFVILSFMTLVVYIAFIIFRRRDIHQVAIAAAALLVTVLLWDWLSTSHDQTSPPRPRPPPPPPQAETQTQTQPQPQPPPPLEDIFYPLRPLLQPLCYPNPLLRRDQQIYLSYMNEY